MGCKADKLIVGIYDHWMTEMQEGVKNEKNALHVMTWMKKILDQSNEVP